MGKKLGLFQEFVFLQHVEVINECLYFGNLLLFPMVSLVLNVFSSLGCKGQKEFNFHHVKSIMFLWNQFKFPKEYMKRHMLFVPFHVDFLRGYWDHSYSIIIWNNNVWITLYILKDVGMLNEWIRSSVPSSIQPDKQFIHPRHPSRCPVCLWGNQGPSV
jgi:hypothetical protein